jgi:hypothetical protein
MKKSYASHIFMSLLLGIVTLGCLVLLALDLAPLFRSSYTASFTVSYCEGGGRRSNPTTLCYGTVTNGKSDVKYGNSVTLLSSYSSGSIIDVRVNDKGDTFSRGAIIAKSATLCIPILLFAFFTVYMFKTRKNK